MYTAFGNRANLRVFSAGVLVYTVAMPIGECGKATVRLGVVSLMVAALASAWELLALQAPGSPLHIGVLPGPVTALRELALVVGLLLLAAGLLMPWATGQRGEPRVLTRMLHAGTVLALGAQAYGAAQGMNGVQLGDLRADALPVFVFKQGGLAVLVGALLELGRRVLLAPPPLQTRQLDPGEHDH
jgi:uncharacterized membrane protein (DUF441 family)